MLEIDCYRILGTVTSHANCSTNIPAAAAFSSQGFSGEKKNQHKEKMLSLNLQLLKPPHTATLDKYIRMIFL